MCKIYFSLDFWVVFLQLNWRVMVPHHENTDWTSTGTLCCFLARMHGIVCIAVPVAAEHSWQHATEETGGKGGSDSLKYQRIPERCLVLKSPFGHCLHCTSIHLTVNVERHQAHSVWVFFSPRVSITIAKSFCRTKWVFFFPPLFDCILTVSRAAGHQASRDRSRSRLVGGCPARCGSPGNDLNENRPSQDRVRTSPSYERHFCHLFTLRLIQNLPLPHINQSKKKTF